MSQHRYIVGNWKMNGLMADGLQIIQSLTAKCESFKADRASLVVCPPATLLFKLSEKRVPSLPLGIQDCHQEAKGAFTGNIAAPMAKEAGADFAILGHSERRQYHGETDDIIQKKAVAAIGAKMMAIICVGETLEEREGGKALSVLSAQIEKAVPPAANAENTIIAYEPVWAIGTGKTAQSADIQEAHAHIRKQLSAKLGGEGSKISILYGGSVKASNAKEILAVPGVDGALVGGASLNVDEFFDIYRSLP